MSNNSSNNNNNLAELLKKLWLPIASFIGAVTLAYNFYRLWLGDRQTVTYFLAGGGLLILIIALGWVGFSKKTVVHEPERPMGPRKKESVPRYSLRFRRVAWISLGVIFTGLVFGGKSLVQRRQAEKLELQTQATLLVQATQTAEWTQKTQATQNALVTQEAVQTQQGQATQYAQATQQAIQTQQAQATQYAQATQQARQEMEEKLVVVIALFEGPEEVYGLRNEIVESLNSTFAQDEDVEIITVNDVISPDMGSSYAKALGEQLIADLVIWGWYRPTENPNITVHVENLSPTQIETLQESETYEPQATLAQLESFEIQRQLGSETSTLISYLIGTLKYESKDHQAAIEYFERILSQDDVSTFVNHFDLFFNLGYSYSEIGNHKLSVQYWDKAIEIDPQNALAYGNRGYSYDILEEYEQAIQDYDKAIELNPELALAYNGRGNSYYDLEEYEQAIQDYDKAIEIDPEYAFAYSNRGNSYNDLGEYELAIQDFDKAIKLNPEFVLAYNGRGNAYKSSGNLRRAIQDYDKAIELDPKFAHAYNGRGSYYSNLEEYERAIQDYDKAIELDPEFLFAYLNRGLAYYFLDQEERAIQDYDKAIELDPEFASAYNNRGDAYQKLGKNAEAEADFKKYEELTGQKP